MDNQIFAALLGVIGSVIGGVAGGYMAIRASRFATKEAFENTVFLQKQAQNNAIRGVLLGFQTELNVLKGIYESEFISEIMNLEDGQPFEYHYPINQNYFTIYESNAALIGQIPDDELRSLIINIYLRLKGLIDTHVYNNHLLDERDQIATLLAQNKTPDLVNKEVLINKGLAEYGINIKNNYLGLIESLNEFNPKAEDVIQELSSDSLNNLR